MIYPWFLCALGALMSGWPQWSLWFTPQSTVRATGIILLAIGFCTILVVDELRKLR